MTKEQKVKISNHLQIVIDNIEEIAKIQIPFGDEAELVLMELTMCILKLCTLIGKIPYDK